IRLAPEVSFEALLENFSRMMRNAALAVHHQIAAEPISVRQRMSDVLARLRGGVHVVFSSLVNRSEGREGIVVNFLAVLELARTGFASLTQASVFAPLYVQSRGLSDESDEEAPATQDNPEQNDG